MRIGSKIQPEGPQGLGASFMLQRRWTRRRIFNMAMNGLVTLIALIAVLPLFSVLYMVTLRGLTRFRLSMLWQLPPGPNMINGGFGNALIGTALIVALAALLSVPVGIATAVYLTEFPGKPKAAHVVRFAAKILSGLPSILSGVFIFAAVVATSRSFSLFAGSLALAVLMLPIVTLATEEALLRVPRQLREASLALGATTSQTVLRVVIPAGRSAILTGLSLAVARAAGETAPLIFTALFSDYWIGNLFEPTASLSVLIYNFSNVPYENQIDIAWSASLILILCVLGTNVAAYRISRRTRMRL